MVILGILAMCSGRPQEGTGTTGDDGMGDGGRGQSETLTVKAVKAATHDVKAATHHVKAATHHVEATAKAKGSTKGLPRQLNIPLPVIDPVPVSIPLPVPDSLPIPLEIPQDIRASPPSSSLFPGLIPLR